jgi:hypothetical protein
MASNNRMINEFGYGKDEEGSSCGPVRSITLAFA